MPEEGPNGKSDKNFVKSSAVATGVAAAGAAGGGDLRRPGAGWGAGDLRPLGDGVGDLLRPRGFAPGDGTCNDAVLADDGDTAVAVAGGGWDEDEGWRFCGAVTAGGRAAELAAGTAIDNC